MHGPPNAPMTAPHERPSTSPTALWWSAALHLLGWLPAAAMVFYAKHRLLDMHGYRIVARSTGRLTADEIGGLERLLFYKEDVLLGLVVLPWVLLVVLRFLRPTARSIVSGATGLVVFLVTFVQMSTFDQVGRYGSIDMFRSAVDHLDQDPEVLGHFLSPRTLLKIGMPCLTIVFLAWAAGRADPRRTAASASLRRVGLAVGRASVVPLALLLLVGSAGILEAPDGRTSYHRSVLLQIASSLRGTGPVDTSLYERLSDAELETFYRDLTHAPPNELFPEYFGEAMGMDVLVFVCETGPARYLDVGGDLSDLPTLQRLRERAFVAPQHHTTYPYTNRALFSFYSSLYPSSLTRSFNQQLPRMQLQALPHRLGIRGYRTGIVSPVALKFEDDERMYQALGFDDFPAVKEDGKLEDGESMLALDRDALKLLEAALERLIDRDERWFLSFHPQIGHAPWPDVSLEGGLDSVAERGRALFQLQDRWLGRLVDLLERKGRLDRTLIVFTADHGIRTKLGDPELVAGRLDAYSFHVPLLVWAPMVLDETFRVPWLTSHIDVAPTLGHLLGVAPTLPAQGSPLWDERLARRTTFFFGNHYMGADGFHRGGGFVMRAHVADEVYETPGRMVFQEQHLVPRDTPRHFDAQHVIRRMVGLQETWVRHFASRDEP